MSVKYPIFARRDLDGFFGLFIDNLVQLQLIVVLCGFACGMSGEHRSLIFKNILPGAAVSILLGNLFYAWQARRLAMRTGRTDVTALPYGINTPSLLIFISFVMAPAYKRFNDPQVAWELGLVACFGSALIEFFGAFVADAVRRRTPRAALLSTLAGIAVGFIAMDFFLQISLKPLIAGLPLAVVLLTYFARVRFPWHLPGGFVGVLCGTALAWGLTGLCGAWSGAPDWVRGQTMELGRVHGALGDLGWSLPQFVGDRLWARLSRPGEWLEYLSVIVPMGLFNLVGSLQNIESAEAAGDAYDTRASLAMNGLGSLSAALFGSCFPTTIYIGHPGWKELGARAGYSTLNGIVITALCLTGVVSVVNAVIPLEAGVPIVLWIGVIIVAQAFQASPPAHAPAVAIGLFPAIVAWGMNIVAGTFDIAGGKTIQAVLEQAPDARLNGYLLAGLLMVDRGYIFSCMILGALSANLIDRKFAAAAGWALVGAAFAIVGLTHAVQVRGNEADFLFLTSLPREGAWAVRGGNMALGYVLMAAAFWIARRFSVAEPTGSKGGTAH